MKRKINFPLMISPMSINAILGKSVGLEKNVSTTIVKVIKNSGEIIQEEEE